MYQYWFKWVAVSFAIVLSVVSCDQKNTKNKKTAERPNILFAISDDQSYPYASAYGNKTLHTPVFDLVAQSGILFHNVFCAAPQCSPNRAAILTGRNIWQIEEAGTHASYFPRKFAVFTDALESAGYSLGYTGKAWGPGNWKDAGWDRNPVGPGYNSLQFDTVPTNGISKTDYAGNFQEFLRQRKSDRPFFFWYGGFEPHRVYEEQSGQKAGKTLESATVPPFLPDVPEIRSDILDYAREIEWFDSQLGKMIDLLKEIGEYENTIIIITADNGMAFPYAKANLQEFGIHVPMAICGPGIRSGLISHDLISHTDLAPTICDLAGIEIMDESVGTSFYSLITGSQDEFNSRDWIVTGRERHTHARADNLGYPARAIRTQDFLFIQNLKPDRWPAGDPEIIEKVKQDDGTTLDVASSGYFDIDASPTKEYIRVHQKEFPKEFNLGFGKRPAEELFDINSDPGCLNNLAALPAYQRIVTELNEKLTEIRRVQEDPRLTGDSEIFESYPRVSPMRNFPGFKERSTYNPAFQNDK